MKRAITSAMRSGAEGIKVRSGGRLGGAEMARIEGYSEGRVPLHTLRADIDYGFWEANTTFGKIGVKVWINKGEIMPEGFDTGRPAGRRRSAGRLMVTGRRAACRGLVKRPGPWTWTKPEEDEDKRCYYQKGSSTAKQHRGRMAGTVQGPDHGAVRRIRAAGPRAGLDHQPADRGGPYRHDPQDQAGWEGVDQHLPAEADHQEAGRDPHGLRQRLARQVGGRGEARPGDVRAGRASPRSWPRRPSGWRRTNFLSNADSRPGRMGALKAKDLVDLADEELEQRLKQSREELFNLRFQHAAGQLENTSRLRQVRHDIARIMTVQIVERTGEGALMAEQRKRSSSGSGRAWSSPTRWTRPSWCEVTSVKPHPQYKKVVRRTSRLKAHDEHNEARMGDTVLVRECRPLSRDKTWRLIRVLERAE